MAGGRGRRKKKAIFAGVFPNHPSATHGSKLKINQCYAGDRKVMGEK